MTVSVTPTAGSNRRARRAQRGTVQATARRPRSASADIAAILAPVPALIACRRHEAAIEALKHALLQEPNSAAAHILMAVLSYEIKNYRQANDLYNAAGKLAGASDTGALLVLRGDLLTASGRPDEAKKAYLACLAKPAAGTPVWAQARALFRLGQADLADGSDAAAQALLDRALALTPDDPMILAAQAVTLERLGDRLGAMQAYKRATERAPDDAGLFNDFGGLLVRMKRLDEGLAAYRIAGRLRPDNTIVQNNIANTYFQMQRHDEALTAFERVLALDPADDYARHMASSLRGDAAPERASDGYVKTTFDQFAATFEDKLSTLGYSGPEKIERALADLIGPGDGDLAVLDGGCGTGWCGPFLRRYAGHLDGVDLSSGMLEKARRRDVYDDLVESELTGFLLQRPGTYDLIVDADVLCYFGALEEVMTASAVALIPGGHLVFTVERWDGEEDFHLNPHGRYSHAEAYIRRLLADNGLTPVKMEDIQLRTEAGKPVMALLVCAQLDEIG